MEETNQFSSPKPFFENRNSKLLVILIVILLVAGGVWLYWQSSLSSPEKLFFNASNAFSQSDFDEAIETYEKGLRIDPDNPAILAGLITTYATRGTRTGTESEAVVKAQQYVERALSVAGDNPDVLIATGYLAEVDGRYEEAIGFYQDALDIDSTFAQAWFHLGHAYEFLNQIDASKEAYSKAYGLDSAHPLILLAQARMALLDRNLQGAYELYLTVATNNTNAIYVRAEAFTSASSIRRNQGYFGDARGWAQLAIILDRMYVPGLVEYGLALALDGEVEEALVYLEEATNKNPRMSYPYWALGTVARSVQSFPESIDFFNTGLEKIDNDNTLVRTEEKIRARARMLYDLGKTYSVSGDDETALPFLEQAVELNENLGVLLKSEFEEFGYFSGLSNNERFLALIRL